MLPYIGEYAECARKQQEQGQEAESLITFTVQTEAAGSDAQDIKSSLCSLHAINQTM